MRFRIGRYEVSQADDCVEIRFPQLDDSEKIDKRTELFRRRLPNLQKAIL